MAKRSLDFQSQEQPHSYSSPKKTLKIEQLSPLSPGNIKSEDPHATVHALVTSVSPITPSRFFEGELTDGDSIIRIVGFDKHQRQKIDNFCTKGIPITLKDCQIQTNTFKNKLEIVIKNYTVVEESDLHFKVSDPKTVGSALVKLNQLDTLQEYDLVTVKVTVLKVHNPQTVGTGKTKQDVLIADDTAKSSITLWESHVNSLKEHKSYQLNKMVVRSYLGKYHLSRPQTGSSVEDVTDIEDIVQDSDTDDEEQLIATSVLAVQQLEKLYTCINCKRNVQPHTKPSLGVCSSCNTVQKLSTPKLTAKLFLLDEEQQRTTLRAYSDMLKLIAGTDDVTCEDLLLAPKFDVKYNKFHIITSISRQ